MYLKMIIKQSSIVTTATVTHLNEMLTVLDQKMVELDSNVAAFNEHYSSIIQQLKAHGKSTKDLNQIIYLMKGYMACKDKEFVAYMKAKKHRHNNGKEILDPMQLLADTVSFYDIAVESKQWKKTLQSHQ